MRFISEIEAKAFFKKLGFQPQGLVPGSRAATKLKTDHLFYQSGIVPYAKIASLLTDTQGDFADCVVWPFDLVWGDRSQEDNPPEAWETYARWRRDHGEELNLRERPGHVFSAGEQAELARLLELALSMGWDTLVAARPAKMLFEFSHNDRISLHSRSHDTDLLSALAKLGVKGS